LRSPVKLRRADISLTACYGHSQSQGPGTPIWVLLERALHVFAAQAKVAYMVPHLGMGVAFAQPVPADQLLVLSL
jgi:hypothetical protein